MKKLLVIALMLLFIPVDLPAENVALDTEETLQVPTSQKMDWYIDHINAQNKTMIVKYRWKDATDSPINLNGKSWQEWRCQDIEVPGTNAECLGTSDPYECCTGVGTGTCDDMLDTCFTDVFGFQIRAQDVGTGIGVGLRTLIWNQFKQDVLTSGNDGTFD